MMVLYLELFPTTALFLTFATYIISEITFVRSLYWFELVIMLLMHNVFLAEIRECEESDLLEGSVRRCFRERIKISGKRTMVRKLRS